MVQVENREYDYGSEVYCVPNQATGVILSCKASHGLLVYKVYIKSLDITTFYLETDLRKNWHVGIIEVEKGWFSDS